MLIASLLAAALSTASPGINLQSDTRPLRDVSPAQENVSADAVTPACKTQPVEASGPAPTEPPTMASFAQARTLRTASTHRC